jgi:hypothetical protein
MSEPLFRSLALLQLASPALPVGAFSYSEAIETLVDKGQVRSAADLTDWLRQELRVGSIRLEAIGTLFTTGINGFRPCEKRKNCGYKVGKWGDRWSPWPRISTQPIPP